jgi:O-antigen/teichoic acid export membrane protein
MSAGTPSIRPIGSNTGFIFASQTAGSILRALYAALLARELGPELFGLMNYGLGWYAAFLAVANLQLESYMSRQLALGEGNPSGILSDTMTLRIFSTGIVFAVALASVLASDARGLLASVLMIYAIAIVGRSAAMWCNSAFVSRERAGHVLKMEVTFRIIEVCVGSLALLMGSGLIGIALIHSVSWLGQAAYGFWLVHRHLSNIRFQPRLREQVALFRSVLPIAVASIAATWLMQGPFVLHMAQGSVGSDTGVVALILQLFVFAAGIPVALGRAALPALTRTVARNDKKEGIFLALVLRTAIAGTAALVIAADSAGARLIAPILGEDYGPAGQYLAYGMLLVLPFGVASIANQILLAHHRNRQAMLSSVVGAAVMTLLVFRFHSADSGIPVYLLCVFSGMLAWCCAALALLWSTIGLEWRRCLLRPTLAAGIGIGMYFGLAGTIGTGASCIVGLATLLAGQILFNVVDRKELTALMRFAQTRRNREPSR